MVKTSHFERMAKYYDTATKILMMGTYGKVRDTITDVPKVKRALDLCCGTGYVTGHIKADQVVALDLSSGMLKVNTDKNKGTTSVTPLVGDAFNLPFPDASFDGVYNTLAAHEFKRIENILKEAYRVLKPGGTMILYDFNDPHNPLLRYTYLPFLRHIVELGTFFVYDEEGWKKIFREAGFQDIQCQTLYKASVLIRAGKR